MQQVKTINSILLLIILSALMAFTSLSTVKNNGVFFIVVPCYK